MLTTISDDLDKVQEKLQDGEKLWMRDELLRYYNDGYKELMSKSGCTTRLTILDVPGRFTYTYSYDWEVSVLSGNPIQIMYPCNDTTMVSTFIWEAQALETLAPTRSQFGVTQLWEIGYTGTTDHHFTFALPKSHDHIKRITWDDQLLYPTSVKELDYSDRIWYYAPGEPVWWTMGVGVNNTFELYEIRTDYSAGYELLNWQRGCPREAVGARDYFIYDNNTTQGFFGQAEFGLGEFGGGTVSSTIINGTVREILSPERQYLPMMSGAAPNLILGIIRDFKSTVKSVEVTENVIPDIFLQEQDVPQMIPAQMQKYLRYYCLFRAFAKDSEGRRPDLADHYLMRFNRAITVLKRMGNVTDRDRNYQREEITEVVERPPRVRFPAHYPQVLY